MDKVDFQIKKGKTRPSTILDQHRSSAAANTNRNSQLNHLFQHEMEMMTQRVRTSTKKYK